MDTVSKETRSKIMSRIKSESGIEILPLKMRGFYLRRHPRKIMGKPDFGNAMRKIALFIDGCFWHGCPKHYRRPKSNMDFWDKKIERNMSRDAEVTASLTRDGWTVIRIWECEMDPKPRKRKL